MVPPFLIVFVKYVSTQVVQRETPISKLGETETKSDGFAAKVYISAQDRITKYFMQAGNISTDTA